MIVQKATSAFTLGTLCIHFGIRYSFEDIWRQGFLRNGILLSQSSDAFTISPHFRNSEMTGFEPANCQIEDVVPHAFAKNYLLEV